MRNGSKEKYRTLSLLVCGTVFIGVVCSILSQAGSMSAGVASIIASMSAGVLADVFCEARKNKKQRPKTHKNKKQKLKTHITNPPAQSHEAVEGPSFTEACYGNTCYASMKLAISEGSEVEFDNPPSSYEIKVYVL
jgi:hypothetical protein